jgi:negative regulator of flagellin synthesis FlgM
MKIGSQDNKPAVAPLGTDRKASGTERNGSSAAQAVGGSAQVEISAAASELRSSSTDASFDTEKVARIAQAIRDGQFTVNAEKIADKLISNAQELLGRKSS